MLGYLCVLLIVQAVAVVVPLLSLGMCSSRGRLPLCIVDVVCSRGKL